MVKDGRDLVHLWGSGRKGWGRISMDGVELGNEISTGRGKGWENRNGLGKVVGRDEPR